MKIRLKESQYRLLLREDRLDYLKGQVLVDPKDVDNWEKTKDKPKRPGPDGEEPSVGKKDLKPILDHNDNPIAFLRGAKNVVKLTPETFQALVETINLIRRHLFVLLQVEGHHDKFMSSDGPIIGSSHGSYFSNTHGQKLKLVLGLRSRITKYKQ